MAAELASAERQDVEQHLAACSDCQRLMSGVLHESSTDRAVPRFQPRVLGTEMVLAGRYKIRRFLGMGAMGEVHEADDSLLGKIVAVKTLNARFLGSERAVARLKLEVAAAHRVSHPNVCRIFDLGIDCRDEALGPLMFITMERIEGPTLAALLPDPNLGDCERENILRQLAAGLAAAHVAGVIHRDLKPENVMVTRQPDGAIRAVITDFGLAGLGGSTDAPVGSALSGTPAYAAPERMRGAPATPASDVYSFGLIAYEVLCRRRLLGASPDVRGLPPAWRASVAQALEREPTVRLADGGCLLAAFDTTSGSSRIRRVWIGAAALAAVGALTFVVTRAPVAPAVTLKVAASAALPVAAAASPPRLDLTAPLPFSAPEPPAAPMVRRRRSVRARDAVAPPSVQLAIPPADREDRLVRDVPFDLPPGHQAANLLNPF